MKMKMIRLKNAYIKSSTVDVRNAIETILNFSLFIESEEIRISTVRMSKIVEKELVRNLKQIKITDFFLKTKYSNAGFTSVVINEKKNACTLACVIPLTISRVIYLYDVILGQKRQTSDKWNIR